MSYCCDGTEVERSVQRLLIESADRKEAYSIQNPRAHSPDTKFTIIVIHGQRVVILQDSKHALKTSRNNLFSGARCLAFGNYVMLYQTIHQVAFEEGSPLYHRDVEKLDRQDDNAASRLFSADVLQFFSDHHPEQIGEIVFLFIFGKLIDAYQNRSIPHSERLQMVLRARYFLDRWEIFLLHGAYQKSRYFLSREAVDIFRIIIEGYIALMHLYRDHLDGIAPLLPWLHSTEGCEHVFGEARKIIEDFNLLDFLYMVPKLRVNLRWAVLNSKLSDPKATASGYNHTYFDTRDIDLLALATFPDDAQITKLAESAAQEADSLVSLLGIQPALLQRLQCLTTLANVDSWILPDSSDSDSLRLDEIDSDDDMISVTAQIQEILDREQDPPSSQTARQDQQILELTCAALSLTIEEMSDL